MLRVNWMVATMVLLGGCDGDGETPGDEQDSDSVSEADGSNDTDDSSEEDVTPAFPEGTVQLRVMNLIDATVKMSGTDADGAEVDEEVSSFMFSGYINLPVGTGALTFDFGEDRLVPPGSDVIDLSDYKEFDSVIAWVGEYVGFTGVELMSAGLPVAGQRSIVFGTSGRVVSATPEVGETIELGYTDGPELPLSGIGRYSNGTDQIQWSRSGLIQRFTMSRIPAGGVGYLVSVGISTTGVGEVYFVTDEPGPVSEMITDQRVFTYAATPGTGTTSVTATGPFGTVALATDVPSRSQGDLPAAWMPFDASTLTITHVDGGNTETFSSSVELDQPQGQAMVVVYPVGEALAAKVLEGVPNDRSTGSDERLIAFNLTEKNLTMRCYHAFPAGVGPGMAVPNLLITPGSVNLSTRPVQTCGISVATPPTMPPATTATVTHETGIPRADLRGTHRGFVTEWNTGALRFYIATNPNNLGVIRVMELGVSAVTPN